MTGRVAIVLPTVEVEGPLRLLRALAGSAGFFRPVALGPGDIDVPGIETLHVGRSWLPCFGGRGRAAALADVLDRLRPDVIEVHDDIPAAVRLGARFRPVPVVLVVHTDPQRQHGAADAAARTFLLAQATRVATWSPWLRMRVLDGVHPAMRRCALLPSPDGPSGPTATAAALDALRLDALKAWSRQLHGPI